MGFWRASQRIRIEISARPWGVGEMQMRDLTSTELQAVSGGRTRVHIVELPKAAIDHANEKAHLPGVMTPVPATPA